VWTPNGRRGVGAATAWLGSGERPHLSRRKRPPLGTPSSGRTRRTTAAAGGLGKGRLAREELGSLRRQNHCLQTVCHSAPARRRTAAGALLPIAAGLRKRGQPEPRTSYARPRSALPQARTRPELTSSTQGTRNDAARNARPAAIMSTGSAATRNAARTNKISAITTRRRETVKGLMLIFLSRAPGAEQRPRGDSRPPSSGKGHNLS
jgi:hypothetical protein